MADRTGIATKLARVLGGGTKKSAAATSAEKPTSVGKAAPAKKGAAKKSPAAKPAAAKPSPQKAAATKAAPAKKAASAQAGRAAAPKTRSAVKSPAKTAAATPAKAVKRTTAKTPGVTPAAKATRSAARGAGPAKATTRATTTATKSTRKASSAASDGEYAEIRAALVSRAKELRGEHDRAVSDINDLQRDRIADGAGDDQADAGTKTFEREQEISLANGILDRLTQVEHALDRLDAGTYGHCERCGNPIPKARLEAFPSVTLCVTCKQIEERR
jgi:phage/conjugal plasmid C-4 type zinc finger TraR family protein